MQPSTLVVLFLVLVELRGLAEILEVEKMDEMVEKVDEKNPSQEWDYYGEEVANDERKRRQALGGDFGQEEVEQNSRKKRDGRKSSAIRINQDMTEIKNNTEPLLVEDPPGIGLGHILGVASLVVLVIYIIGISYKLCKIYRGSYVEEDPVFLKYK